MILHPGHVLLFLCLLPILVPSEHVSANVCNYLQCVANSSEVNERLYTIIKYNETIWKQYKPYEMGFDFRAWNWTALNELNLEGGALFEVIFNGLDITQIESLDGHPSVFRFKLEENEIQNVERHAFANFRRLESLSLRANMIGTVEHAFFFYDNVLQNLDLSNNSITTLEGFKDLTWRNLKRLNLSYNRIEHVTNQLVKLDNLEWVDLSDNRIKRIAGPLLLPRNLQHCALNNNQLGDWPFDSVPDTLTHLAIRSNFVNSTKTAIGVRTLNLSYNQLTNFCVGCFPALEALDLSGNYFETVPDWSSLEDVPPLEKLRFSQMPLLQVIKKDTFHKMVNLTEIEINTCPKLTHIDRGSFTRLKRLKKLDLSYNGLTKVPNDMVHWDRIELGVNLQGNPFNCDCSMQWFLDGVIRAMLPHRELHTLFPELRCAQPSVYRNQRMVQLTMYTNILCRKARQISAVGMVNADRDEEDHFVEEIILTCLLVAIIITTYYLIYLRAKRGYRCCPKRSSYVYSN